MLHSLRCCSATVDIVRVRTRGRLESRPLAGAADRARHGNLGTNWHSSRLLRRSRDCIEVSKMCLFAGEVLACVFFAVLEAVRGNFQVSETEKGSVRLGKLDDDLAHLSHFLKDLLLMEKSLSLFR